MLYLKNFFFCGKTIGWDAANLVTLEQEAEVSTITNIPQFDNVWILEISESIHNIDFCKIKLIRTRNNNQVMDLIWGRNLNQNSSLVHCDFQYERPDLWQILFWFLSLNVTKIKEPKEYLPKSRSFILKITMNELYCFKLRPLDSEIYNDQLLQKSSSRSNGWRNVRAPIFLSAVYDRKRNSYFHCAKN